MRRKHSEVTDPREIERVLRTSLIGRMASIDQEGYPYITPVNFVYYEGNIYFHCAPVGEKLDNIARDPRVCFQVDIPLAYLDAGYNPDPRPCKLHQLFHCVIIRGEASVLPNGPIKTAALNALVAKHEPGVELQPVTADQPQYKACAVVQIRPHSITAKSDLNQNKMPEERLAQARYFLKRNEPGDMETVKAMGFDPNAL
jgi:nitroimidazol reductase NimA-like FMN-containing flavoprotein (pyridoxamine 5'-phosphate oxidase superfamily)